MSARSFFRSGGIDSGRERRTIAITCTAGRETVVFAAVNAAGGVRPPMRIAYSEAAAIAAAYKKIRPFVR